MIKSNKLMINLYSPCHVCGKNTPQRRENQKQGKLFCSRVCESSYFATRNPKQYEDRTTVYDFNKQENKFNEVVSKLSGYDSKVNVTQELPLPE